MRRTKRKSGRLNRATGSLAQANRRLASYDLGVGEGYKQGLQAGFSCFDSHFEGTSIIIPSFNEVDAVKRCIEEITEHTELPYEIIVIDYGSTDGIEHYLNRLDGQVRYRLMPPETGYAGAANRGFMMAKGTTIALLDSRVIPTDNWLGHMLACLQSSDKIGLVGPVSNGLGGAQRRERPEASIVEEHLPEEEYCENDAAKWTIVERLSSTCLLFRRELLGLAGYFDEGCQAAPYEVDDYGHRLKLLGLSLVCAEDAYVNIAVEEFNAYSGMTDESSKDTRIYYSNKWNALKRLLASEPTAQISELDIGRQRGLSAYYPQSIVVAGLGGAVYWIENDRKRPVEGEWRGPLVRLSQPDLKRWPVGEPIQAADVLRRTGNAEGLPDELDGMFYEQPDGSCYYIEKGRRRPFINRYAAETWCLSGRTQPEPSEDFDAFPLGLPIVAPTLVRQAL
ncbi:glycosyltransferase family 2 protein [Paenibacillus arenilitoris]|uniref:Glycosyltransferase family 2 protein n=1 Tax=Paenibacillus arenilitoris TaxID=2772299 RepID=A0A927CQ84_9BACL|nr:glycosyltransferase family 2 protein [Paenibacillus arenilitoris]MBD2871515.1 glycosyltransferase family 2 protein [Paenibacillus arenilitoris]